MSAPYWLNNLAQKTAGGSDFVVPVSSLVFDNNNIVVGTVMKCKITFDTLVNYVKINQPVFLTGDTSNSSNVVLNFWLLPSANILYSSKYVEVMTTSRSNAGAGRNIITDNQFTLNVQSYSPEPDNEWYLYCSNSSPTASSHSTSGNFAYAGATVQVLSDPPVADASNFTSVFSQVAPFNLIKIEGYLTEPL